MSAVTERVYKQPMGNTGTRLDELRDSFAQLFKKLDLGSSAITFQQINSSYLFHTGFDMAFLNQAMIFEKSKETLESVLTIMAS